MVRPHFNLDWTFALQRWLGDLVEKNYRPDRHRWPTLVSLDAEVIQCGNTGRLFVIRDKPNAHAAPTVSSGSGAIEWPGALPKVDDPFNLIQLPTLLEAIYGHYKLRQQDYAIIIPESGGATVEEDVQSWTPVQQQAVTFQMDFAIRRQLNYVHGFDQLGHFMLPPGYEFLAPECERFFRDHPRYDRNVFLMTRFQPRNRVLTKLDAELRRVLREHDFDPVRADDKMYMRDRNLWNNVCVYMLCCHKGIAILEDRLADEFNPNVALEYGFMRALNRPTLLLADTGFRNLRADVIGTLRETFDLLDIENTIQPAVERWLAELG